jgi:hypothetical protein
VAREEPVGGPAPEPADRGERSDDLGVGAQREGVEIELGLRELEHALRFAPREAQNGEVARPSFRHAFARGELPRDVVPHAEALDEVGPDGGRRPERDLLSGDRDHERLERPRGQSRAKAWERLDDPAEHGVAYGPRAKRVEIERGTE